VADSGVGLLMLPDSALPAAARRFGFVLEPYPTLDERAVRPRRPHGARSAATPVPAAPYALGATRTGRTVFTGDAGEALAQVMPRGAGRVAATVVAGSSRWVRGGERAAFAAYWSVLLAAVAPPRRDLPRWALGDAAPAQVNRPLEVAVRTTAGPVPAAVLVAPSGAHDSVFLSRDPLDPTRWVGRYWPREPGWHAVGDPGSGADAAVYVAPAGAWAAWRSAERLAATARQALAPGDPPPAGPTARERRPLPLVWWLAAFLLAAGLLWAERRPYIRSMSRTAVAALLALSLPACGKSQDDRVADVRRCSSVNTQADLIALCLTSEHGWKDAAADSAGRVRQRELDSTRQWQEDSMWNADSARHKAELRQCSSGDDVHECLLVRFGWGTDRAGRAADSLWARNAQRHARETRACASSRSAIASCLMLNYKWSARRALATEDSIRRARMR
jgi:hypothetical protein